MVIRAVLLLVAAAAFPASALDAVTVHGGVVFNRPDRKPLKMTIFTPAGEVAGSVRPAVLLIHGGSWLYGSRYQLHWYGRQLARRGYVAASLDYRMMPRYAFPDCLHDCKAAVRFLRRNAAAYGIDPGRIAVMGNSAGGHLAALIAATHPEDGLEGAGAGEEPSSVQAAVVLYGVTDMSYYRNPSGYIRMFGMTAKFIDNFVTRRYTGSGNPYDAASPAHYADERMCPTLFIHGTKDNLVPYGQTVAFAGQLSRAGVPVRLITVRHGHAFDFLVPGARAGIFPEIVQFLDDRLKSPAAAEPHQPRN